MWNWYSKAGISPFFLILHLCKRPKPNRRDYGRIEGAKVVGMKSILTLCKRLIMESLYSEQPSIMPVIGFENHSLNSRCDWNTCGIRKCISDQSSIKLFCSGVPVSSKRLYKSNNNKSNRNYLNVGFTAIKCSKQRFKCIYILFSLEI